MNLTNEEKKKIADSATYLMQAFCEFRMAEDRLKTMNNLIGKVLDMGFNKEMSSAALSPYLEHLKEAQKNFFEILGIGEDNKEFWRYNSQVEHERFEKEHLETPERLPKSTPHIDPSDSCIEG